jgi:hypothetical protein
MTHANAMGQVSRAGVGPDALPAVREVPLAAALTPGFGARAGLGYGWTESVLDADESHHRTQLELAGSWVPARWIALAVRWSGRYDVQSGGADSGDGGLNSEAQACVRVQRRLAASWQGGAELALWLPGADKLGDSPRAISSDLQLFAAYLPERSPLTLGAALGMRVDRSKFTGGEPERYSGADRVALGVSDSVLAARMGLAASYRLEQLELIAEWSWTMYFDYAGRSPMWVVAGARFHASERVQLEALLGVSPSARPPLGDGAPLARIEPRVSATLGAALALPWEERGEPQPGAATPGPHIATASLRGKIVTATAASVAAQVTLEGGDRSLSTHCDEQGEFVFNDVPPGRYRLRATAGGWKIEERTVELDPGAAAPVELAARRELPTGQIRGTVRSFDGKPLAATVLIHALRLERRTDASGAFEIDAAPGEYDVIVKVPGYGDQKRRARVELRGVAILIMELQPKPARK